MATMRIFGVAMAVNRQSRVHELAAFILEKARPPGFRPEKGNTSWGCSRRPSEVIFKTIAACRKRNFARVPERRMFTGILKIRMGGRIFFRSRPGVWGCTGRALSGHNTPSIESSFGPIDHEFQVRVPFKMGTWPLKWTQRAARLSAALLADRRNVSLHPRIDMAKLFASENRRALCQRVRFKFTAAYGLHQDYPAENLLSRREAVQLSAGTSKFEVGDCPAAPRQE